MSKLKKKIKQGLLVFLLLAVGFGAYFGQKYYQSFVAVNINTEGGDQYLYLSRGVDQQDVLDLLNEMGLVKNRRSLNWLANKKNYKGSNVIPGKYKIEENLTNNQLINHLRLGNGRLEVRMRFGQLRNIEQLSAALSSGIEPDSASIYSWLSNRDSISHYGFNQHTITSMFIPNTYFLNWEVSVSGLMKRMANEYKKFWTEDRQQKAKAAGLSQSQVITLASIVYWETKASVDMPQIAGVYMNRLRLGMPLQADPTLIFALDDYSIKRVLNVHKQIDSPYNTYKNKGLPPGPILIPPIAYVDAVLNYTKHDYLYFVAKEDFSGKSYFAETYAQHLVYARRFQRALNERGIYR